MVLAVPTFLSANWPLALTIKSSPTIQPLAPVVSMSAVRMLSYILSLAVIPLIVTDFGEISAVVPV